MKTISNFLLGTLEFLVLTISVQVLILPLVFIYLRHEAAQQYMGSLLFVWGFTTLLALLSDLDRLLEDSSLNLKILETISK